MLHTPSSLSLSLPLFFSLFPCPSLSFLPFLPLFLSLFPPPSLPLSFSLSPSLFPPSSLPLPLSPSLSPPPFLPPPTFLTPPSSPSPPQSSHPPIYISTFFKHRLKLFLEQFSIKSCVLNSELPHNSRCSGSHSSI